MTMQPVDPNDPFAGMMPQQRQGGMFGGGGVGRAIAGMIGDYLLQRSGMRPMYAPIMQMRQQQMMEEQDYQRQRHDKREDFVFEHDYEARHPKPASPHYFEDNTGNLMMVGPDGQPTMVYKDPNPWKLVPNGMGGVIPVNMQELMGGSAPKPVGKITPLGGPTPPASGGFPGY